MSNKVVCCAIIAIIANLAVSHHITLYYILMCVILSSLMIILLMLKRVRLGFMLIMILVWCVFSFLRFNVDSKNVTNITLDLDKQLVQVEGVIDSSLERDGDRVRFDLKSTALSSDSMAQAVSESILVQIYLDLESDIEQIEQFSRGNLVSISGEITRPNQAQNYEQFDYRQFLINKKIHWILQVDGLEQIKLVSEKTSFMNTVLKYFDRLRVKLYEPFPKLFDKKHAGYLGGLVFGMKSELDPTLFLSFSQLGLTHILAVSGLHVAVVVASILYIFKLIRLPRALSYNITIALLPFYVIITGAEPSIIRAGIMGMIGLWLIKHHKLKNTSSILASAAILMIGINPLIIYNIGFQLSFLVTYGLLIYTPLIRQAISHKKSKLYDAAAVTLSAQLASFPLTIAYFNSFNPLSLLANFILVPYISFVVLPLATLTNILGHFSTAIAKPIAYVTMYSNTLSFIIIDWLNKLTNMNMIWKTPSLLWIVTWYVLIYIMFNTLSQIHTIKELIKQQVNNRFSLIPIYMKSIIFSVLIMILLIYAYNPALFITSKEGKVSFISVGQGDSILITTPTNKNILIDSGGQISFAQKEQWAMRGDPFDVGKDIIVPLLKERGIGELDIIVITHFDADHFQGFLAVLDEIKVNEVWLNGTIKEEKEVNLLLTKIIDKKIPIVIVEQGDEVQLDRHTRLHVLWPSNSLISKKEKQNDHSIVLLLDMYNSQFLFTGDIGEQTERDITTYMHHTYNVKEAIEVLKIAHHGSKYSTSASFLSYFEPRIAVVSVGENNRYGHPHPDILERLNQYDIQLLRTDIQGEVIFSIKKDNIKYTNWNNMHR